MERGKSYSLYLVVYQVTYLNAFNQYVEDRKGSSGEQTLYPVHQAQTRSGAEALS
ncbi:MAG: hypothetical protein K9J85_08045 [Desulfobacteraceae bacterium]|nr:hypothetical protein [Desulfobacteraceae bacterium]